MLKIKNIVPKYRKHRASGQAVVTLNGKDHYLGPYGTKTSHREYDRLVGQWQVNGRSLKTVEDSITIAELASRYLKFAQGYYVKNGRQTDELQCIKSALRVLLTNYCKTPVDEFGPIALESVRNQIVAKGGWCRDYVNKSVGRIRRMFRWGVAKEVVPTVVYQSLMALDGLKQGKTIAKDRPPVLPVADDVLEKTLEHVKPRVKAMILIQRYTGCRPGEVCAIRPCDIDRSADVWIYRPDEHKMQHKGRGRVIPIGPQAQAILMPFLLRESDRYCFEKQGGGKLARWIYAASIKRATAKAFPAPQGLSKEQVKEWNKKHAWTPNQIRHLSATEIRREFGIEAARTVLGHSKTSTTEIYAEKDLNQAIEVAKKIG